MQTSLTNPRLDTPATPLPHLPLQLADHDAPAFIPALPLTYVLQLCMRGAWEDETGMLYISSQQSFHMRGRRHMQKLQQDCGTWQCEAALN